MGVALSLSCISSHNFLWHWNAAKYLDLELRDVNYVEQIDTANQARYGSIVKNIDSFACTSRGQASRLAKWMLYMSNVEREVVTFSCAIDAGVLVRPGQVIEIADPLKAGEEEVVVLLVRQQQL